MKFINTHKNCEPLDFSIPLDIGSVYNIKYRKKEPRIPESENVVEFFYDTKTIKEKFPYNIIFALFCIYIDPDNPEIVATIGVDETAIEASPSIYGERIDFEIRLDESESIALLAILLEPNLSTK